MPIAANRPLMTLSGKNAARKPARAMPSAIWRTPAIRTANRKASNEPSVAIWAAAIAIMLLPGPLTLVCEPLSRPTMIPPMMPETMPANSGAPEAIAMPRQSGRATRNTTSAAERSRETVTALAD